MTDSVKLIIEIPKWFYEETKEFQHPTLIDKAIMNGTPLDTVKSEIREEKECAYADFERYKVEYLGQDWEDVNDSLPDDDFRYGMERCLEIIDKHISRKDEE